jgi:hypothetical protein
MAYTTISRNLTFRCEAAQLPSRTFSTADQKFGSNPLEKHAYHSNYNESELTFIVSDDMSEKIFFDAWMEYINPTASFDFNYRNDYISTITVTQYDVKDNPTYSVNLVDAFPISVNQLDLDWSNDGHHKLVVVFAYRYWQNNYIQEFGSSTYQPLISGALQSAGGLAGNATNPNAVITQPVNNFSGTNVSTPDYGDFDQGSGGDDEWDAETPNYGTFDEGSGGDSWD